MARFSKKVDWVEMWIGDSESMIDTFFEVAEQDIAYPSIYARELQQAYDYRQKVYDTEMMIDYMPEEEAQRWCFRDLVRKGAIG